MWIWGYHVYFFLLAMFYSTFPLRATEVIGLFYIVFMGCREYIVRYETIKMELQANLYKENFNVHLQLFDHLPTGLCIIDKDSVLFVTEKMKNYMNVRQADEIMKRFDEITIQSNNISMDQIQHNDDNP